VIEHLCRLAEEGIGEYVVKGAEVWVMEDVEGFGSRLEIQPFGEGELSPQRVAAQSKFGIHYRD